MNKRQRKKYTSIDASGVREISSMQRYIDNLEDFLWRMAMFIDGKDDGHSIVKFTEQYSRAEFATSKIYDFIKEHKKDNGKQLAD